MYIYHTTKLEENRNLKIQDGSLHSWNAYISAPILDSNARIPTAIGAYLVLECSCSTGLVAIMHDQQRRNRKRIIQNAGILTDNANNFLRYHTRLVF